jgi:integrase
MRLTWRDPAGALNKEGFEGLLPGVGRGWGLHRFRHTCATERLRNGMTIDALKEFLGHATIEQTLAYAKIIASDVRLQSEASDAGMEAALEPEECRVA